MVQPTVEQVLSLIRGGKDNAAVLVKAIGGNHSVFVATSIGNMAGITLGHGGQIGAITAEKFDGLDLSEFELARFTFDQCSFIGAVVTGTGIGSATSCDFSKSSGVCPAFGDIEGSRFIGVKFRGVKFSGSIDSVDFSSSTMEGAHFYEDGWTYTGRKKRQPDSMCVFAGAALGSAKFHDLCLKTPDFDGADLTGAIFASCVIEAGSFRKANLQKAIIVGCKLPGVNLAGANLRGANLANTDFTNACLDGADLAGCNLMGATLSGVNLSKTKNYDPSAASIGLVGPALSELDSLSQTARRIEITFRIRTGKDDEGEEVGIDTSGLRYGWGLQVPPSVSGSQYPHASTKIFSVAMMQLATLLGQRQVRYETVDISSTKSPKSGRELRDLVINGIAEAFAQPVPAADELAAATKTYREQVRQRQAGE
ncbi:MAG: pentapeptide repeat-containing protein, partial [Planctomycetaceae bacterium]